MKTINFKKLTFILLISVAAISSCKKHDDDHDDDHNHDENELITTVAIQFVDTISKDTLFYKWSQPGGPGSAIAIDTIMLKPNVKYIATTTILDESKNPTFNVSEEIKADANNHRFVYTPTNTNLGIKILDFDTHTPPIELGLNFEANAGVVTQSNGNLNVVLKHYTVSSPKTGGLANGSTDIEVNFPLVIK
jgi:hypothetical protein